MRYAHTFQRNTYRFVFNNFILADGLRDSKDLIGNALRSRSAIGDIVLDTKIVVRTARVVAGSQENTAVRLILPDNIGSGGSR